MNGNIPRRSDGVALTRQEQLLLLIESRCGPDGTYYVPSPRVEYINGSIGFFDIGIVYGAGDMSALRALLRRGQIEEVRPRSSDRHVTGYRITEDGKRRAQTIG